MERLRYESRLKSETVEKWMGATARGGSIERTRAQAASCSDLGRGGEEESTARLERKENESLTAYFVGFRFFFYLIDTIPPY